MRILITEQFNKAVVKLNDTDKKQVFALFSRLEGMSKKEIFESRLLTKIAPSDEKIYVLKSKFVRVFCTFENDGEQDDLIFLDVIRKNSSRLKMPFNLTRRYRYKN